MTTHNHLKKALHSLLKTNASGVPVWLLWLSNLSQFGLLVTAIVVYVFTVIPVYKLGLLEEEIAQKTKELKIKTMELHDKENKLAELTPKLKTLEKALEDGYRQIRSDSVGSFINYTGAACSGILIPPERPSRFGEKERGGPSHDEQILNIDLATCLQRELGSSGALKRLRKEDLELLSSELRRIASKLEPERKIATREYRDFPAKAAKDPSLLKSVGDFTESLLSLPMSPQTREALRIKAAVKQSQSAIVHAYADRIRSEIRSLNSLHWK